MNLVFSEIVKRSNRKTPSHSILYTFLDTQAVEIVVYGKEIKEVKLKYLGGLQKTDKENSLFYFPS